MRSGLRAAAVLIVGAAMIGAWGLLAGDGVVAQPGTQIRSPAVSIGEAESHRWSVLSNNAGVTRPDFPRPLIAQDTLLCFGFERLDFDGPASPSLARCVDREDLRSLSRGSVASVFRVKAGFDTWHVVAFGAPMDEIQVVLAGNTKLSPERVFVGDRIVALRLSNEAEIDSVAWTIGRTEYQCEPTPDVVNSGNFCN